MLGGKSLKSTDSLVLEIHISLADIGMSPKSKLGHERTKLETGIPPGRAHGEPKGPRAQMKEGPLDPGPNGRKGGTLGPRA